MTKAAIIAMLLAKYCTTTCYPPPPGCSWCGQTCETLCVRQDKTPNATKIIPVQNRCTTVCSGYPVKTCTTRC